MKIYETKLNDDLLKKLILFSEEWEKESCTYGYYKNQKEDIEGNRIFIAEENSQIIGYLFATEKISEKDSSIIKKSEKYMEIEEIYIAKEQRKKGIGQELFKAAEKNFKNEGYNQIILTAANRNYKALLHFYIDELDMNLWNATLFKKL